jgi:hypothetical protein
MRSLPRVLLTLAALSLSAPVAAQQVPLRDIPAPAREIEDPFSLVTGGVELKPGQILLYDGVESELSLVNFADGSRAPLGRQGSGPGEYKAPAGIFRMSGDTIWVLDAMQQRIVVFNPDLKAGTTFPFQLFDAQSRSALTAPMVADRRGRIYASAMTIQAGGGRGNMQMTFPDSVDVVRVDPRVGADRTSLARVRFPTSGSPRMQQSGSAMKYSMAYPGLVAADAWTVFPDGRIAIVRGATYTVEFIAPDGAKSAPVRVAYDQFPVTAADQKAEMDEARKQMADQSKAVQKMMPANVTMEFELLAPESWPDAYPPVSPLGVMAAPNGQLWVRRSVPVRVGRDQWDVLDRTGKLVARWRLPAKTMLLAVGDGAIYTVRTDEDDLRYVQRVSLPR